MSKNLIDIFKYFGNEDFARANRDREFGIEEMLSIMMHSEEIDVEERIADLKTLANHVGEDMRAKIERVIARESYKLDFIKKIKADDTCFIRYGNDIIGKYLDKYATFDEVMASGIEDEAVFINAFSDPEHRKSSIAHFTVRHGRVTSIGLTTGEENVALERESREFREREVALDSPFKPFDIIVVGGKRYVVADTEAGCSVNERETFGWLNVTIPVYKVGSDGRVTIDIVRKLPWMISEVKRLDLKQISLQDIENVDYIKSHIA